MNRVKRDIIEGLHYALLSNLCFGLIMIFMAGLSACGGGGGDDTEQPETPTNQTVSTATETNAQCVYSVGTDGEFVNLGEYTGNPEQIEELARSKADYFVWSCTGDVNLTINQTTTTTTEVPNGED